jgi:hypothetical protein
MSNIIPFRDPDAPLDGAERKAYWKAAEAVAAYTVAKAFSAACRQPGCGRLGCEDALPLFVTAFRRELSKMDYCLHQRSGQTIERE